MEYDARMGRRKQKVLSRSKTLARMRDSWRRPGPIRSNLLEQNIGALRGVNRELALRLCTAVSLEHLDTSDPDNPIYRVHRTTYPLRADENSADVMLTAVPDGGAILLFGAGVGTMLNGIRRSLPTTEIHIWDRDPAILRLLLTHIDIREELKHGGIHLHLGADLLDLLEERDQFQFVPHPLLGQIYTQEAHLWEVGLGEKIACVSTGGLLVADLEDALRDRGYTVYPLDMSKVSRTEIDYTLKKSQPELIAGINYITGMEMIAHDHGIPLICWDMDPTTDKLPQLDGDSSLLHLFSCRPGLVETFKTQGFNNVSHLPLAANPKRRRPLTLTPEEYERYGAHVSFVGASLVQEAMQFQESFLQAYKAWRGTDDGLAEGKALLDTILAAQRADFSCYRIPELMEEHMGDFLQFVTRRDATLDPSRWLAEIAAMEKRLSIMANLGSFRPAVWGDAGWKSIEQYGVRYKGAAGHLEELTRVYNGTMINVDIGRIYQTDIPPMRIFDIMACGAFLLAEYSDSVAGLFTVGEEIDTWSCLAELKSKIRWYIKHPDAAGKIAAKGLAAVRRNHTVDQRLDIMLKRSGLE
jgi:spore maturation protein CgeB